MSRWRWFLCLFIGASLGFATKYFPVQTYLSLDWLAQVATGIDGGKTGEWVLYGVGLFATVAVTPVVTRIARQSLAMKAPR